MRQRAIICGVSKVERIDECLLGGLPCAGDCGKQVIDRSGIACQRDGQCCRGVIGCRHKINSRSLADLHYDGQAVIIHIIGERDTTSQCRKQIYRSILRHFLEPGVGLGSQVRVRRRLAVLALREFRPFIVNILCLDSGLQLHSMLDRQRFGRVLGNISARLIEGPATVLDGAENEMRCVGDRRHIRRLDQLDRPAAIVILRDIDRQLCTRAIICVGVAQKIKFTAGKADLTARAGNTAGGVIDHPVGDGDFRLYIIFIIDRALRTRLNRAVRTLGFRNCPLNICGRGRAAG